MPVINHILIFISYVLVIGAGVVSLPQYLPMQEFDVHPAMWQGGAAVMVVAMLHLALSRFGRDRKVMKEIALLKSGTVELRSELTRARDEAKRIYEAIEAAGQARHGRPAEIEQIMTEVRMLQGLVEQISQRSGMEAQARTVGEKPAAASRSSGPAKAASPQPPPVEPQLQPAPPPRRVITGPQRGRDARHRARRVAQQPRRSLHSADRQPAAAQAPPLRMLLAHPRRRFVDDRARAVPRHRRARGADRGNRQYAAVPLRPARAPGAEAQDA